MKSSHYIYILKCCDNSLYTGYTNNVEKRVETHRQGKGSKYVRSRLPVMIIYSEQFDNKIEAMKREAEIKKWDRETKIKNLSLNV
jgi:putative endonuclease